MRHTTEPGWREELGGSTMPRQRRFLILASTLFLVFGHAAKTLAIGFTSPINHLVGTTPIATATGDFNRDGKLDLAVGNSGSLTISVLIGNGTGAFQLFRTYVVTQSLRSLAVGDFNRDGRLDLVVAKAGSVAVLRGNGDGTFAPALTSSGDSSFGALAVRDLNHDGRLDLAVTDGGNVSILLGRGDGTFRAPTLYSIGFSYFTALSLAIGDFDHDTTPDLVVAVFTYNSVSSYSGQITILLGNGDGTFRPGAKYAAGGRPNAVVVRDLNRDGALDVAVTVHPSFALYQTRVLLGNGDGTFRTPVTIDAQSGDFWLAASDFNGDGTPDLAASSSAFFRSGFQFVYVPSIRVLLGKGDGSFQVARSFVLKASPQSVTAGNLNSTVDSLPDLVVTNPRNTIGILLNTSAATGADLASNIFIGGSSPQSPTYTVTANNRGPKGATNVVLTDTLPSDVSFVSAGASQGTCSWSGLQVVCNFGSLPAGGIAFVRIAVTAPTAPYSLTNSATVTAVEFDPNRKNNTSTSTVASP